MKAVYSTIVAVCAAASQASLIYTFDTDNQGWRQSNFNQVTLALSDVGPASWNAGGYIDGPDFADWAFHTSPILSGGYAGATSISFDFSTDVTDGQPYPFIVLASATEAIFQSPILPGDGLFHPYSFDLTSPANWVYGNGSGFRPATNADITNILTGLQRIGINADIISGADYTRVDNVRLNAVPEPMTLAVLGLGCASLLRRRRIG